jgi:hypothetical protein
MHGWTRKRAAARRGSGYLGHVLMEHRSGLIVCDTLSRAKYHSRNPRVIQFLAGWTSLRMLDRYGHVRDTEVRRAVTENADHVAQALKAEATDVATDEKINAGKSEH